MELRHLEQVLEICRAGGFSGAARRLQVSQPTLSKSISRLEAQLSVALFERSGAGARPTAHGAFLAERAEALLQQVAALTRELEQRARGEEGRLRIAVGPATRVKPLPQFLRRAAERFPQLHVETRVAIGPGVVDALRKGRVDLAFAYSEHAARYGELIRKKLYECPILVVARPGHPALHLERATAAELLRHPFALTGVSQGLERWAGELSREQRENFRAFVSDDYGLIIRRVLETDTITLGPAFLFDELLACGRLKTISSTLEVTYACWLLTTPERWRSPLIKSLAALAKLAAADDAPAESRSA